MMKAAVVTDFGSGFEVMDVELASPLEHEVVVDVRASGLCHSDHTVATTDVGMPLPAVLGHEIAGVVSAVGSRVTTVAVGDHVTACLVQYCGRCQACVAGHNYRCLDRDAVLRSPGQPPRLSHPDMIIDQGFALGGFAEQSLVHEHQVVKIPDEVPFPQAAVIGCGVVTGAGAVLNTAALRQGETAVIIGAGGVGLNAVQGAVLAGASRIVAIDIDDRKLDRAVTFGATDLINSREHDPVEALRDLLPWGADSVFDFVGSRAVTTQAFEMLAVGGGLYLVGVSGANPGLDIASAALQWRHAKVQGVGAGSTNPPRDIPMYANLYLQGRLELDALVSKTITLAEIDSAYEAMKADSLARVVITKF